MENAPDFAPKRARASLTNPNQTATPLRSHVYVSAVLPGGISPVVYSLGYPLLVSLVLAPFAKVNDAWLAHVDACTLARSPFDAHERTYLLGLLRDMPAQMSLHGFVLTTWRLRMLIVVLYCLALYCVARYLAFYSYL